MHDFQVSHRDHVGQPKVANENHSKSQDCLEQRVKILESRVFQSGCTGARELQVASSPRHEQSEIGMHVLKCLDDGLAATSTCKDLGLTLGGNSKISRLVSASANICNVSFARHAETA